MAVRRPRRAGPREAIMDALSDPKTEPACPEVIAVSRRPSEPEAPPIREPRRDESGGGKRRSFLLALLRALGAWSA
jgi:hypothetical protein